MISKSWRHLPVLLAAAALAVAAGACSKSADSTQASPAPESASPRTPEPSAGADMEPTAVAPEAGGGDMEVVKKLVKPADQLGADHPADGRATPEGAAAKVVAGGADKAAPAAGASKGASADTEWYTVEVSAPATVASGGKGTATVTITPKTGWKLNHDFPTRLTVQPPAGIEVLKPQQRREDAQTFVDKSAVFAVPFTASSAGDKRFQADLKFAVCTDETCDPKKEQLAWVVSVE